MAADDGRRADVIIAHYEMSDYLAHWQWTAGAFVLLAVVVSMGWLGSTEGFWCAVVMLGYFAFHVIDAHFNKQDFEVKNSLFKDFKGTPHEIYEQYLAYRNNLLIDEVVK